MQNNMSQKQIAFTIKIVSWVITVLFTLIQFFLIIFVLFGNVTQRNFELQLSIITGTLMLSFNISMIVIYCRYAGMPYRSQQHYDNLKHIGFVATYWTFAFILKFITAFIDKLQPGLNNIDKSDQN